MNVTLQAMSHRVSVSVGRCGGRYRSTSRSRMRCLGGTNYSGYSWKWSWSRGRGLWGLSRSRPGTPHANAI